jgi:hypothetical protein
MLLNRCFSICSTVAVALVLGTGLGATPARADVSLNSGFGQTSISGTAGGSASLRDIAGKDETATGSCLGFGKGQPDQILRLNSAFRDLTVVVNSSVDTTIVVKGPGGTWCNDDFQGKDPGLDGQWQAGEYQVWIGTQGRNQSVNYVLKVNQ